MCFLGDRMVFVRHILQENACSPDGWVFCGIQIDWSDLGEDFAMLIIFLAPDHLETLFALIIHLLPTLRGLLLVSMGRGLAVSLIVIFIWTFLMFSSFGLYQTHAIQFPTLFSETMLKASNGRIWWSSSRCLCLWAAWEWKQTKWLSNLMQTSVFWYKNR